ncbi:hypothetical protein C0584_01230 [Candidatus Parcubacteria bacterium]|nr:MAG: hypothetical protein C0584_01230 [Candidatus Parcubacteria bacterium]
MREDIAAIIKKIEGDAELAKMIELVAVNMDQIRFFAIGAKLRVELKNLALMGEIQIFAWYATQCQNASTIWIEGLVLSVLKKKTSGFKRIN